MHLLSHIIYSCKTLCMFRMVFPSIIRSSKLAYTATVYVKQLLLPAASSSCLFDIYCCCIRSFELVMMEGKTVRNMQSVLQE